MARRDHDDRPAPADPALPSSETEDALDAAELELDEGDLSEQDDDGSVHEDDDDIRAADTDDDDDDDDDDGGQAADADDDDDDDDDDTDEAPAPRRRSLGPTLLTLGGGVWAIAAALHCGAPSPGPSLSVSPDAPTAAKSEDPSAPASPEQPSSADADRPEPDPAKADRPDEPDQPDLVDEPPEPEPEPEDWATDPTEPTKVAYTIRRGGSIKNVANLFKIFHHEITALNPGVTLDQELPPNSKVVVYLKEDGQSSESVGYPSGGTLEGGVPMVEGPGRVLKMIPWKSWGTAHTVAMLDRVLRQWAKRGPQVQPVLVGNMASRKGGRLEPHSTHQSGRDVDISYIQILPEGEQLNWREMTKANLDAGETWELLKLLRATGQVEVIFIDSSIQKLLYEHAVEHGTVPKASLSRWLQYPKSGGRRPLIQHVKGHVDHIHVRFKCQAHESRCKSKDR